MRIAWLTDIHLGHVQTAEVLWAFWKQVRDAKADAVVISGDLCDGPNLALTLDEIARQITCPLYFVLGNHEYYHVGFAEMDAQLPSLLAPHPHLTYLSRSGVIRLTEHTALVGHDGWTDGRLGNYAKSGVMLMDYVMIPELTNLDHQARLAVMQARADQAAVYLEAQLMAALADYPRVLVVTHYPPWREATQYMGKISDEDFLPHFGSRVMGEAIERAAARYPNAKILVLCGHTHSGCDLEIAPNIAVMAGEAEYDAPVVQEVLTVK
jgi:predicted MPP superfamily phosphohydrolase